MIVYKIKNKINGKLYIGQTIQSLEKRWKAHLKKTSNCTILKNAIKKYGSKNFEVSIVSFCDNSEQMNKREIKYIKIFKSKHPNGYNVFGGGNDYRHTKETKRKLSEINKNTIPPSRKDCRLTEKHKKQISKKMKGRKRSKQTIEKFKNTLKKTGTSNKQVRCLNNNKKYQSMSEAARELNLTPLGVSRNARGLSKSCKGYRFVMENI